MSEDDPELEIGDVDDVPAEPTEEPIVIKKKRETPKYLRESLLLKDGILLVKDSFPKKKFTGTNAEKLRQLMRAYQMWGRVFVPFLDLDTFIQRTASFGSSHIIKQNMMHLREGEPLDLSIVPEEIRIALNMPSQHTADNQDDGLRTVVVAAVSQPGFTPAEPLNMRALERQRELDALKMQLESDQDTGWGFASTVDRDVGDMEDTERSLRASEKPSKKTMAEDDLDAYEAALGL